MNKHPATVALSVFLCTAAFAAPAVDWTQHVPQIEFPFLKAVYGYDGAKSAVENVHLANEGHDYGPSKRAAATRFLAQRLGLATVPPLNADGSIDESHVTIEHATVMHVWDRDYPVPADALHTAQAVEQEIRALQQDQSS